MATVKIPSKESKDSLLDVINRSPVVIIRDSEIVIFFRDDKEYQISISECNSYRKILKWVMHLHEKAWTDKDIIDEFIGVALQVAGLAHPAQ
jgi:helix-turn-helix protein